MLRFLELVMWNWVIGMITAVAAALSLVGWLLWKVKFNVTVFTDIMDRVEVTFKDNRPKWQQNLDWVWRPIVWPFFIPKGTYHVYKEMLKLLRLARIEP